MMRNTASHVELCVEAMQEVQGAAKSWATVQDCMDVPEAASPLQHLADTTQQTQPIASNSSQAYLVALLLLLLLLHLLSLLLSASALLTWPRGQQQAAQ
jgi:hypothetical protein